MIFHGHLAIETSQEIWDELFKAHRDQLSVFSSYTCMEAGVLETCYGFYDADYPIIGARTIIEDPNNPMSSRTYKYFLILPKKDSES